MKKVSLNSILPIFIVFLLHFLCFGISAQNTEEVKELTAKEIEKANVLYQKGNLHYNNKEYNKAAVAYLASYTISKNKYSVYNAACAYALNSDTMNAILYAKVAMELGMYGFDKDPDFDPIRLNPVFMQISKEASAKLALLKEDMGPVIILPEKYDENNKHILIVALHGFGGSADNFANVYKEVANKNNAVLLSCTGSEMLGKNSFGWNFGKAEQLRLKKEIETVISDYSIDRKRIILTGFSQGGRLTYELGLAWPKMFCGLIPVAGIWPPKAESVNIENSSMKVYAIVGNKDKPKYLEDNQKASEVFKQNNIEFRLETFDIGHTYPPERNAVLEKIIDWILNSSND